MNYQKMIDARKRRIKAFVETGLYSLDDIAMFFYTLPDYVRIDIEKMGYSTELLPYSNNSEIKELTHERNQLLWKDLITLSIDEVLEKHGLPMLPYEFPELRNDFPCREYKALWDGIKYVDLPKYLGESRSQVLASLRKYGYKTTQDFSNIRKIGKEDRKLALMSETVKCYEVHMKSTEIQKELNISEDELSKIKLLLIDCKRQIIPRLANNRL